MVERRGIRWNCVIGDERTHFRVGTTLNMVEQDGSGRKIMQELWDKTEHMWIKVIRGWTRAEQCEQGYRGTAQNKVGKGT